MRRDKHSLSAKDMAFLMDTEPNRPVRLREVWGVSVDVLDEKLDPPAVVRQFWTFAQKEDADFFLAVARGMLN